MRCGEHWVSLPPLGADLAATPITSFGAVVRRDELLRFAWSGSAPPRNSLDVHVLRLRRRLAPLGLAIRTVRGHGYVLESADP